MKRETGNIFSWLGRRQEEEVMNDAQKHVEVVLKTVLAFQEAIKAFAAGSASQKEIAIKKVREFEHEADTLRTKMVDRLSEGVLLPPDREDLLHFVKSLDRIADWTNGAARFLGFLDDGLPRNVVDNINKSTETIVLAVQKLREAINALLKDDFKKCLEDCREIEMLETVGDDQKKASLETILKSDLTPPKLLVTFQLAEYIEGITDKIEDASDFIKIVAVKSK